MTEHGRCLLADKMGLGKSITALASAKLTGALDGRVLIPCSKSALSVWRNEVKLWFPQLAERLVVVEGSPAKRAKQWQFANEKECIMVSTYGVLDRDQEMVRKDWDLMMTDEAHKALRNHKLDGFKTLHEFESELLYEITGSPASKGIFHMFGYLNLMDPKKFSSYWQFINRYGIFDNGAFGREFLGNQNMDELKEILSTRMIRRMKSGNMPKKHRRKHWVEMSNEEKRIYEQIDKTGILPRADGTYLLSSIQATNQLRCRQLFICPKLLDPTLDVGTGIRSICEQYEENELKHSVVFCPFPAAFQYLKPFIEQELKVPVYILRGGMDSVAVQATIEAWKASGGIILCSIQFATSFNLTKASIAFMLGFEWDQDHNYQAEDRLHRMGIKEDVMIYYVMHDNVLTHRQLEIMNAKVTITGEIYER